jgi:hypothetical protein
LIDTQNEKRKKVKLFLRPCLVIPKMSRNGGDRRGLNPPQASDRIIPPQSLLIRVNLGINEHDIRELPSVGRKEADNNLKIKEVHLREKEHNLLVHGPGEAILRLYCNGPD